MLCSRSCSVASTIDGLRADAPDHPEANLTDFRRVRWNHWCCFRAPSVLGHPPWRRPQLAPSRETAHRPPARGGRASSERRESRIQYGRAHELRMVDFEARGCQWRSAARSALDISWWRAGGGGPRLRHGSSPDPNPDPDRPKQVEEVVAKAPPWLFSAESDRSGRGGRVATFGERLATDDDRALCMLELARLDGRRAAMRAWGRWHARDIHEVELVRQAALACACCRIHRLRITSGGAHAEELMAHLRVLTWAAHATQRTPVLPLMECHQPGSRWVDEHIDVRTGLPTVRRGSVEGQPTRRHVLVDGRCTRWQRGPPAPLCMQRPHEGCFHAFATPDELALTFRRATGTARAPWRHHPSHHSGPSARASLPASAAGPGRGWWTSVQPGGRRHAFSAASSPHPELDHLYALLAPFMVTTHRRPRPRGRVGRSQSAAQLDSDGLAELALGRGVGASSQRL